MAGEGKGEDYGSSNARRLYAFKALCRSEVSGEVDGLNGRGASSNTLSSVLPVAKRTYCPMVRSGLHCSCRVRWLSADSGRALPNTKQPFKDILQPGKRQQSPLFEDG